MTTDVGTSAGPGGPVRQPQVAGFRRRCEQVAGHPLPTPADLHHFSVTCRQEFWRLLLDWSGLVWEGAPDPSCTGDDVETAAFFPGIRLNYAENLLRALPDADDAAPALTSVHPGRPPRHLSRGELRAAVARAAAALDRIGVGVGDRVVAVLPNHAEAVVAALAVAARGATLSTAAPEMGTTALLGRFAQVEPAVLLVDRSGLPTGPQAAEDALGALLAGLPTVRRLVVLDDLPLPAPAGVAVSRWAELVAGAPPGSPADWPRLPFDHPLWVMFSSGTTGAPKAMVHGAGGSLLEHVKEHRLHGDLRADDTLHFHTSTAWMMWNWQLSALAVGAHVVVHDGPVTGPATLWELAAAHRVTVLGTSPAYLQLCQDEGYRPAAAADLSALRTVLSTGAVLHDWQYDWFADAVGPLPLQSISGGTDLVGCFVLGHPEAPVQRGRSSSLSLGLDVAALGEDGQPVVGEVGELVCRRPFPSRPLGFLADPDGARFHDAYFAEHPGVWVHGDLVEIGPDGSARVHGRSDGVLNVDGIRVGPSEIYTIVRAHPAVSDAMAVEQREPDRPGSTRLVLLVVLRPGHQLTDVLVRELRAALRSQGSPAHVPAVVLAVPDLPYTHNGKRSESAARAALDGAPVRNAAALRDPGCLARIAEAAAAGPAGADPLAPPAASGGDATTDAVARAFRDVLGDPRLDPDADFFDAGGSSRSSMTLLRRLRIELGRSVPMDLFLAAPSIAGLSAALAAQQPGDEMVLETLADGDPDRPPLFLVHGAYGDVDSYRVLAGRLRVPGPVYGICGRTTAADGTPRSVVDLAVEHAVTLDRLYPAGPVRLSGYSFGGLVAFEMARRLRASGRVVDFLGLLDPAPPSASLTPRQRRLRAVGKRLALVLPGFADTTLRRTVQARFRPRASTPEARALRQASQVSNGYRWQPYPGPVTYFRAARRVPVVTNLLYAWRRVAPDLRVVDVPGAHHDLLRERSCAVLAERLTAALPADG